MKSRALKRVAIAIVAVIVALVCVVTIALAMLQGRTDALRDDYSNMLTDAKYSAPVQVEGVKVIEQKVSCGYAVIEMFSAWDGGSITEESLYDEYGKVVTSTGQSFCDEMNKQFPRYKTGMCGEVDAGRFRGIRIPRGGRPTTC